MTKIKTVEVANLLYRYPDDQVYVCAEGHMGSRVTSLVFVELDNGLTGVGSAYSHPQLVRVVVDHLTPFLVGEDPLAIDALWNRMYSLTRWYGRKGAAISALGAIDIALWDLKGKIEGAPVYKLLGGSSNRVLAYASGLLWQDDLLLLAGEATRHLGDGFRLMKMRLGRDETYDRNAVECVASTIAGQGRVAVDGTHRYSMEGAIRLAGLFTQLGVAWFEEPFPPEDVESYGRLRQNVQVQISAGENEFGLQGFRELFRVAAVDIAQPDASRTGGISECVRIGQLAEEFEVDVISHTWSDAVALVANAHVVASLNNGTAVEVDRTGCPFMDHLLHESPEIVDGHLLLSERPGLGVDVDMDFVKDHQLPAGTPILSGNYADMVFGGGAYASVPPFLVDNSQTAK